MSMPGNRSGRLAAINCSSHTNLKPLGAGVLATESSELHYPDNELRQGIRNLDASEMLLPLRSRTTTARFKLRLEM